MHKISLVNKSQMSPVNNNVAIFILGGSAQGEWTFDLASGSLVVNRDPIGSQQVLAVAQPRHDSFMTCGRQTDHGRVGSVTVCLPRVLDAGRTRSLSVTFHLSLVARGTRVAASETRTVMGGWHGR